MEQTDLERLASKLTAAKVTVATAESCTAGGVGYALTTLPGSSTYYVGGVITYTNAMKQQLIGVSPGSLDRYTAVSQPVAKEMAEGVRQTCGADYGLSVTGLAGPGGGTPDKPVGLVYIGIATPQETTVYTFYGTGNRQEIREQVIAHGLSLLEQVVDATHPSL